MNVGTTVVTISNQIDANRWLQVVWRGGESQTRECFCPREPVVIQRLDLVLVFYPRGLLVHDHTPERERERFWVSALSSMKSLAAVESQWSRYHRMGMNSLEWQLGFFRPSQ